MTDMQAKIDRAREVAEIKVLREEVDRLEGIVRRIQNGILEGAQVPFTMPDGSTVLVTKAKPRKGKE